MGLFDNIRGNPDKKIRKEVIETQKRLWNSCDIKILVDFSLDKIRELPKEPREDGDEQVSEIYAWTAHGVWEQTRIKEKALGLALTAFRFNRVNEKALWLIREINESYSSNTKTFKVLAHGYYGNALTGESKRLPFYASYIVASETPEEGLKIIKEYELADIAESLTIEEYEELEENQDLPKGIYKTAGLTFYDEEEIEE